MKYMGRISVPQVVGCACLIVLTGCMPTAEETYDMVREHRQEAYARWASRREDKGALPHLTGGLSLEAAIATALVNNTRLRGVLEQKQIARGQVVEAYGEALPVLEASSAYWHKGDAAGPAGFPSTEKDNYSVELSLTQPLYRGGKIGAALRAARYFSTLSDETVRRQAQDTIRDVAGAYYDVLLAEFLVEVQKDALAFAVRNRDDVAARLKAQVVIPFDLLRAEVEVSNVEADLIGQQNNLDLARTQLLRLMGVSQRSSVTLTDRNVLDFVQLAPSFEESVQTAFENRPELYEAELNVKLREEAVRAARGRYRPELEAFAGHAWARPSSDGDEWDDDWQVGLRLRWDLFDGLAREGQIIQRKAELRQAAVALLDAEQTILQEVRDTVLALKNAEKLALSQARNVERAREARRLIEIGVKEGVNTSLEALDARSALTQAEGLHYQALHRHATARLRLQRVLGLLGAGPGQDARTVDGPFIEVPENTSSESNTENQIGEQP